MYILSIEHRCKVVTYENKNAHYYTVHDDHEKISGEPHYIINLELTKRKEN